MRKAYVILLNSDIKAKESASFTPKEANFLQQYILGAIAEEYDHRKGCRITRILDPAREKLQNFQEYPLSPRNVDVCWDYLTSIG